MSYHLTGKRRSPPFVRNAGVFQLAARRLTFTKQGEVQGRRLTLETPALTSPPMHPEARLKANLLTFVERLRGQVPIYIISISYNTPVSVGCKRKILNFVIVIRQCRTDIHIVKVFFASPFAKMWKFSFWMDDTEQHSLSYR